VQPDVGFAAKRDPSSAARNIPNHPPPSFSKARASPSTVLVYAHTDHARRETLAVYQHIALDEKLEERYQEAMKKVEL